MDVRLLTGTKDLERYDAWVKAHPMGSLWQSIEWKTFQEALGRETRIFALMEGAQILASALVVIDRTSFGLSTWDIPRGPLLAEQMNNGQWTMDNAVSTLLEQITTDARKDHCLSIYLSPSKQLSIFHSPFRITPSGRHEQPQATRILDLTRTEEEILRQMKPKGRYNITVAEKNGVRVEESQDVDAFYALMKETGGRDRFGILPKAHYETFLKALHGSFLFLATAPSPTPLPRIGGGDGGGGVIAGLLGVIWGSNGIYYYGASSYDHRAFMAPYALQWAAMRHCKTKGCVSYDLLGIAPPDAGEDHPWHGVGTFKEKFGGEVVTYLPEQQIILRPMAFHLLALKRRLWK
ncbi:MAG: peptidoglycan bridge formation glycyltransferase FemA/FemB family protein [Candidatus Peribacteraceae bacterium]|nr:peptidoglycan bridge formation glycyltransferase FemA/FemB family protein [Candidatus Peribacteraceae bacterium]MDD5074881.1 peptidoglycan bridge formation glycyltransferase FemA/FemB family protein [Candidatus Peribacteraceae bacterium]